MSIPIDFNFEHYKFLNNDLQNMTDEELNYHYINYGCKEGRKYSMTLPKDFNSTEYKLLNNDLEHMNDNELKFHYINYGYKEERKYKISLPDDFDLDHYKFLNNDLIDMNYDQLKIHYINYGCYNNYIYKIQLPEKFNSNHYKILYKHLKYLDNEGLINHYINHGYYENKNYYIDLFENDIFNNNTNILKNINLSNNINIDYISKLLTDYNCLETNDRIKIKNLNIDNINNINNINNDNITLKNFDKIDYNIFYKNNEYQKNHKNYKIYINNNSNIKNSILILSNNNIIYNSELIFNVNYKIISNKIIDYKYFINLDDFNKNYCNGQDLFKNINYIIYENNYDFEYLINNRLIYNKYIEESLDLNEYFNSKIFLFQILIPDFNNLPEKLLNTINSWEDKKIWICKFDKFLGEKFIYNNYSLNVYYTYKIIYSVTSKTDLLRHCLLYKYSGIYMDNSIRILDKDFYNIILEYDYFTSCSNDYEEDMSNGILFTKNKFADLSYLFIKEIVSGVINDYIYNKRSNLFGQLPSENIFFYGPTTLYYIYISLLNKKNILIGKNILVEHAKNTNNSSKNEFCHKVLINDKYYLQIKYIGYYSDLESKTNNNHYSFNFNNNLHFYSILEVIDRILIINLSHRTDRKAHILNELNKFILSNDKYEIIDAIYDKNGVNGCAKSHIKCIEYAKKNNYKNCLILEDDYCFNNIDIFNNKLSKFLFNNINWDGLLLSFSEHGPPLYIKTSIEDIYKFYWSQNASAYIINNTIYDDLLNAINKGLNKENPIDWSWNYNKYNYNWYGIKDTFGYQKDDYSDIENQNVSYKKMNI